MGNVKIKVDITGGRAPVPILIFIYNIDGNRSTYERDYSFDESFPIEEGEHNIIISGENPIDGQTDIQVEYRDNHGQLKKKAYNIKILPIYSRIFKVFI